MSASTSEWLLEISGLTVGPDQGCDVVDRGHLLAAEVRSAAAAFRSVSPAHDWADAACPMAAHDGGHAACLLAETLLPGPVAEGSGIDARTAARRYLGALRAASTAVFNCRHAHAAGECWFSPDGTPRCGDVLAVTHRLGV